MKILYVALLGLFFVLPALGQNVSQLKEKIDKSITTESLNSILEAGKSGDKSFVPYLKKLASQKDSKFVLDTVSSYAQIALARLGEEDYLSAIVKDVDNENIFLQDIAIRKLAYIGGKSAFKEFYRLLNDKEFRVEKLTPEDIQKINETGLSSRKGDEVLEPRSFLVMKILSKMIDNPPVSPDTQPSEKDINIWKAWFKEHKDLIE